MSISLCLLFVNLALSLPQMAANSLIYNATYHAAAHAEAVVVH